MNFTKKGFTLIELLIVIAIIGILASVILISVNAARDKAKNVRVLTSVKQIRTTLESNYLNGAYIGITPSGTNNTANISLSGPNSSDIIQLITDIGHLNANSNAVTIGGVNQDLFTDGQVGGTGADTGVVIFTTNNTGLATDYAIYASTTVGYICMDSTGNTQAQGSGTITSVPLDANSKVICR